MRDAYICDFVRTPIGRFAGGLSSVRTDDLAAVPIKELVTRNQSIDWQQVDEVVFGCASTTINCLVCKEVMAKPTGGKSEITARVLEVLE